LVLLQEDGAIGKGAFKPSPRVVVNGWLPEYSDFFVRSTVNVADLSSELGMIINRSTHLVVIGSHNNHVNNILFEITPDTAPPLGGAPVAKIRCKSVGRRYEPQIS
jgi:hypothetical protein